MNQPLVLSKIVVQRGDFSLQVNKLELAAGRIACLVGPNGGGKTTLLLTALGLLPHEGQCRVNGTVYDGSQPALKALIGFIPDDPELLFAEYTAREQWVLKASLLVRWRPGATRQGLAMQAAELARSLGFDPPPTIAASYSHGMRKKTQIVNALIGTPPVIIVDELRNGLDPLAIQQAEQLLRRERDRGAAILAATHDLWWAERFADHVYVIHEGRVVASGAPATLLRRGEKNLEQAFFRIVGASA